jgi:hypothetical protein
MGAAGKNFRFTGMLLEQRAGLGYGRRFEVVEVLHGSLRSRSRFQLQSYAEQNLSLCTLTSRYI